MESFCPKILFVAVVIICSYFLLMATPAAARSLQQIEQASCMLNHVHRIKRGVSHNNTSPNVTKVQNVTTTGVPTVATTLRRRLVHGWLTKKGNTPRPSGMPALNLTDDEKEKILNRSAVPLDHLGFPIIHNSHRGTLQPQPPTQSNASGPTPNLGGDNGNGEHVNEILAEFRLRENKTQASTLPSNTNTSTNSIELPQTGKGQKNTHNNKRRDMSMVISKHGIWIAVVASLLLSAFICLTVNWVRQRRGKLLIAPAGNIRQRSAAVVYKA